jgi:membrane protease YdiL (CAAX protease family)
LEEVIMETSALAPSASDPYRQVAGPLHTILLLAILGAWAFLGRIIADQMRATVNPHRLRFYVLTLFFEWLLFIFLVVGVRWSGAPVRLVLGDRWQSVRQVLRDIGIAAAFWIVSGILLFILAWLLRVAEHRPSMEFILPHGAVEITVWMALSITAGICEETVFRGYLQRQFTALTKSVPAGILLSAAAFGAAHAYQGFRMVILIGLYGAMFGILAHWRGSVRPGMIAHAWQDCLGGVLSGLARH